MSDEILVLVIISLIMLALILRANADGGSRACFYAWCWLVRRHVGWRNLLTGDLSPIYIRKESVLHDVLDIDS